MSEKKKPDLVVWTEERGYYQRELFYGSNLGAPAIQLEDVEGWKKNQASELNKHFNVKYEELKQQFDKLVEEVQWNNIVYNSQYNFTPVIGESYFLYERDNKTKFLSLIEPSTCNFNFIGEFKLDSNKKWNKI